MFLSLWICLLPLSRFVHSIGFTADKRQDDLPECRLKYETDVWTGCDDVIAQFGLHLDQFLGANPELSDHCEGFVPGETYCIYRYKERVPPLNVTTDGSCGPKVNFTQTCVGSEFGDCCGSDARCGSGKEYCGIGNCQEGSCDGGRPFSIDGHCGRGFRYLPCPPKFGLCCSEAGNCGNGTECGPGCQGGPCDEFSTTTSSTAVPTPTLPPGSVSEDGTCGYGNKYISEGSEFGDCCSAAGYCGDTIYYCLDLLGCQADYGSCDSGATS